MDIPSFLQLETKRNSCSSVKFSFWMSYAVITHNIGDKEVIKKLTEVIIFRLDRLLGIPETLGH